MRHGYSYGYGYGRSAVDLDSLPVVDAGTQENSLRVLAELAQRASTNQLVHNVAQIIVRREVCGARDDACELKAIFDAVKTGDPKCAPLINGFKYLADPRVADYFTSPADILRNCLKGACAGDCDDHAGLIAALGATIGFKMGLRAWGRKDSNGFAHVYAVAAYPKRPIEISSKQYGFDRVLGMDTTVDESSVGWEPPKGNIMTAWLE